MYLSFPIDSNDSRCSFMGCSHKNGLATYSVHVDAGAGLQVIQMNVTVFSDEKDDIMFGAHLWEKKCVLDVMNECMVTITPVKSNYLHTCMATGKSFCASGGKNTSTAFFGNGWLPVGGVPTSII